MFVGKDGKFQYFLITDGETHLIETRSPDNPIENEDFFVDYLNENYLLTPNWEAVGAFCYSRHRESQRSVITYVSGDILYDWKKPIYQAARDLTKKEYPNAFHKVVDLPGEHFPELDGRQTFSRGEDGYWKRKDVPVERAIFASKGSSGSCKVDGYDFHLDHLGRPYTELEPQEDIFVHFCSKDRFQALQQENKIQNPQQKIWSNSALWGGKVSPKEDHDVAVLFQTKQSPSFAHPEKGALWRKDIHVDDFSVVDPSIAEKSKPLSPLPSVGKVQDEMGRQIHTEHTYIKYSSSKMARLPLGNPGGPCHLLHNIEDSNLPDEVKEDLKKDVYEDGHIEKGEEGHLYNAKSIRLQDSPPFHSVALTYHAQHRMDQRSISEEDIKKAFDEFSRWYRYRKRNPQEVSSEDEEKLKKIQRGESIGFEASKIGLFISFRKGSSRGEAALITAFWQGKPDPNPPSPGECKNLLKRTTMASNVAQKYAGCGHEGCNCGEDCDCDHSHGEFDIEHSEMPSQSPDREIETGGHFFHSPLRK